MVEHVAAYNNAIKNQIGDNQSASVLRSRKHQSREAGHQSNQDGLGTLRTTNLPLSLRAQKTDKRNKGDHSLVSVTSRMAGGSMHLSEESQSKISQAVHTMATPVRLATDYLLRASWTSVIGTFGLSLIWTNIHVFFRYVLGTAFFSKLGHEWTSGRGKAMGSVAGDSKMLKGAGTAGNAIGQTAKVAETAVGAIESLVLLSADLLVFFLFLVIIILICFVVGMIVSPVEFIGQTIF